jgi:very-short-patch-repair endonuclease
VNAGLFTPPPLEGLGREADQGWGEGSERTPSLLLGHARGMRQSPTPAERKLWLGLRNHRLGGLKFRRQMPLGPFIADFYCPSAQVVVEVDGVSHIDSQTDERRDAWMSERGTRALRFSDKDVLTNFEGVLSAIQQCACGTPPPNLGPLRGPSPQGEGE